MNIPMGERHAIRTRAAAIFGLPVEQIRFYGELTELQSRWVTWTYNTIAPDDYVYAVAVSHNMVPRRERIRPEWHFEVSV